MKSTQFKVFFFTLSSVFSVCKTFKQLQLRGDPQTNSVDVYAAGLVIFLIICRPERKNFKDVMEAAGYRRQFPDGMNQAAVSLQYFITNVKQFIFLYQLRFFFLRFNKKCLTNRKLQYFKQEARVQCKDQQPIR